MQHILFSLVSAIIGINLLVASGTTEQYETPSFEHYDVESVVAINTTPMPYVASSHESEEERERLFKAPNETNTVGPQIEEPISITHIPSETTIVTGTLSATLTPTITATITPTCTEATCVPSETPTPSVSPSVRVTQTPAPTIQPLDRSMIQPTPTIDICGLPNPSPYIPKPQFDNRMVCL